MDTNCIIDLEKNRVPASYLKKLIEMHGDRKINLRVVAISASENPKNGIAVSHINEFKEKINAVGLGDVEILPTLFYYGLAFYGYCIYGDKRSTELEKKYRGSYSLQLS